MEDCIFCKIVKDEIPSEKLYEDEDILAFKDVNPIAPIHILLIPKKHISNLLDIKSEDNKVIIKIFQTINKLANELKIDNSGFRVIINCGTDAGQKVMHLHFHLIAGKKMETK